MRVLSNTLLAAFLCVAVSAGFAAENVPQAESPFSSALQESMRLQEEIDRYNEQVADLESEYGPFDPILLESLQGLTGILVQAMDYDEANRVLQRRLQLIRTSDGPASLNQVSLIEEAIANDIRRNDWESVTDRYEYLHWLNSQDAQADPASALNARAQVIQWHLTAVSLDAPIKRVRHLQDAREHLRQGLGDARDTYPQDSLELVPWIYRDALMQYQIGCFLASEDELGYYALQEIGRIEVKDQSDFVREGLHAVKRIRDITQAHGDLEAEAMAMIYDADFQMILNLGTAARLYRQAMDKFMEAGISQQQIDTFFARPIPLPVPEFYMTMSEAMAAQEAMGFKPAENDEARTDLGRYVAWNESLPIARQPAMPPTAASAADAIPLHEIVLDFDLNSRGTTRNPKIVESSTDAARVRSEAREAVRDLRFRPRFEGRRWRRMEELRITYLVPPQL